jgi:hypothetical protein
MVVVELVGVVVELVVELILHHDVRAHQSDL